MAEVLRRGRRLELVEGPDGDFQPTRRDKRSRAAEIGPPLRLEGGEFVGSISTKTHSLLAGSRVEIVLAPSRFVFRQLELPLRAADFLEGVVREQIDRLTPWRSSDAAFGWSAPVNLDDKRIVVTVAATPRASLAPIAQVPARSGARRRRPRRKGGGDARERHPHRADAHGCFRAHPRRRSAEAFALPSQIVRQALISRIKILAGLNTAERRLPQDGAARMRVAGLEVDIRVTTMPTHHGEAAVIRLLPRDRGLLEIGKLGLSTADERKLRRALDLPHGMVVVTGPTGSGKTTTLATMLSALNTPFRKILTIEDPIEYEIPGINQSQVKPAIGLTFATAMRAFARLDPDVIMVGEARDAETANTAIHAASTGHLVLPTLHTETALAAVPRLIDLGVEGFLLKSTLRSVLAPRLVRLLCDRCKAQRQLAAADLAADPRFELCGLATGDVIFEPKGCERCGGVGYRGRVGVFKALEITNEVRDLIGRDAGSGVLNEAAARADMTPMVSDAMAKCRAGVTSISEVLRVAMVR